MSHCAAPDRAGSSPCLARGGMAGGEASSEFEAVNDTHRDRVQAGRAADR